MTGPRFMMIEPLTVNGIFPSWNKGNSTNSKIAVFFRINGVFMENKFSAPGEIFHLRYILIP